MDRVVVYPGSFDPMTNGHIEIVNRSMALFDQVHIGILRHPQKEPLFTVEERIEMIDEIYAGTPEVTVQASEGLLVDFAESDWAILILAANSFTESIFFPIPPDLLLIGQPTRGVDIGASEFIHKRIVELRELDGIDSRVPRDYRLPIFLGLVEEPLHNARGARRKVRAHDGGDIEVLFEMQRHIGRQDRGAG